MIITILGAANRSLEVHVPDGWEPIEEGMMKASDKYLVGGIHNAPLLYSPSETAMFQDCSKLDELKEINSDMLIIRENTSEDRIIPCKECGVGPTICHAEWCSHG